MGRQKIEKFKSDLLIYKKIGLDSMIFIYQFADNPLYGPLTEVVFEFLEQGKLQAITSSITIAEVFVLPEKVKDQMLISEYEKVFQNLPNLEIVPFDWQLARLTSKLRAKYPAITTPDAIQISTSILKNYPAFLTNDKKLQQINLLKVIILKDYL